MGGKNYFWQKQVAFWQHSANRFCYAHKKSRWTHHKTIKELNETVCIHHIGNHTYDLPVWQLRLCHCTQHLNSNNCRLTTSYWLTNYRRVNAADSLIRSEDVTNHSFNGAKQNTFSNWKATWKREKTSKFLKQAKGTNKRTRSYKNRKRTLKYFVTLQSWHRQIRS